mmetsp:Transcript_15485/g.33701  ORF Transcript_15485/g.33701 Transcript_15485/m.33701 type:complete len:92 (+) Transcript_15485:599-874(+)
MMTKLKQYLDCKGNEHGQIDKIKNLCHFFTFCDKVEGTKAHRDTVDDNQDDDSILKYVAIDGKIANVLKLRWKPAVAWYFPETVYSYRVSQ